MSTAFDNAAQPLTGKHIFSTWWPLAASWLMMAFELPAVSAIMARLSDPSIHLAAYGGVVFPLALIVEAPVIMLLAASTALSKDWNAYTRLRGFMITLAVALTIVHLLIVFTPLFEVIVVRLMGAPEPIRAPARIGLIIMAPWTAAIAYRRFQQGVLIRSGRGKFVSIGTGVRLAANFSVLGLGIVTGNWSGIVVGTSAVALGVVAEAIFVGWAVRPAVRQLRDLPREAPLTLGRLFEFYIPLALTSLITLLALPVVSAGLGRMPRPIESLAAWPVVNGLIFALRSMGIAFNEVVVALLDRPRADIRLFRFAGGLAVATTLPLLVMLGTPLGRIWFSDISGLAPNLAALGLSSLWLGLILPAQSVYLSWFQGVMVHEHKTRGISEAVALSLTVIGLILTVGVHLGRFPGLAVGLTALSLGGLMQLTWLAIRSRAARANLREKSKLPDQLRQGLSR